jgi:hypothetical protein
MAMEILKKKWLEKETIILPLHNAVILQNNRRARICQFAFTIEGPIQAITKEVLSSRIIKKGGRSDVFAWLFFEE